MCGGARVRPRRGAGVRGRAHCGVLGRARSACSPAAWWTGASVPAAWTVDEAPPLYDDLLSHQRRAREGHSGRGPPHPTDDRAQRSVRSQLSRTRSCRSCRACVLQRRAGACGARFAAVAAPAAARWPCAPRWPRLTPAARRRLRGRSCRRCTRPRTRAAPPLRMCPSRRRRCAARAPLAWWDAWRCSLRPDVRFCAPPACASPQAYGSCPTPGFLLRGGGGGGGGGGAAAAGGGAPGGTTAAPAGLLAATLRERRTPSLRASSGSGFSAWPSTPTVVGSAPAASGEALASSPALGRGKASSAAAALGVSKKPLGKPQPQVRPPRARRRRARRLRWRAARPAARRGRRRPGSCGSHLACGCKRRADNAAAPRRAAPAAGHQAVGGQVHVPRRAPAALGKGAAPGGGRWRRRAPATFTPPS